MELVTKNGGDVLKVRQADDTAAAVVRTEAEVDYISMMDGIAFDSTEEEEGAMGEEEEDE